MANNSLPSRSKNETVSQIKRPKYEQKYKVDYVREFKGITKSRTGDTYAFCTICHSDLNIAHGGRDDINKETCQCGNSCGRATVDVALRIAGSIAGCNKSRTLIYILFSRAQHRFRCQVCYISDSS